MMAVVIKRYKIFWKKKFFFVRFLFTILLNANYKMQNKSNKKKIKFSCSMSVSLNVKDGKTKKKN